MSLFAVIKTGGKQYIVSEGDTLRIEKLESSKTGKFIFENVLLVSDEKEVHVGTPLVAGASVQAQLVGEGKDKKKKVFRYKSKVRYQKMKGHRQPYTEVKITNIALK